MTSSAILPLLSGQIESGKIGGIDDLELVISGGTSSNILCIVERHQDAVIVMTNIKKIYSDTYSYTVVADFDDRNIQLKHGVDTINIRFSVIDPPTIVIPGYYYDKVILHLPRLASAIERGMRYTK